MLVMAFARFDCCPSLKCRARAAGTYRASRACMSMRVGMGVRFDALGANEYLVIVMRVVCHAVRWLRMCVRGVACVYCAFIC